MKKVSYEILKNGYGEYVLWKNVDEQDFFNAHGAIITCPIMIGSKAECQKRLEELNGTGIRKTKSKKQRTGRKQSTTSRKNKATKKRDKKQR